MLDLDEPPKQLVTLDPVETDVVLADGDRLRFGEVEWGVTHLVGHTPGSIALVYDDPAWYSHVFTGDCLFPGGVGRTTSPADFSSLLEGVSRKLFGRLSEETSVYPRHGDDTNLGAERPRPAEWKVRLVRRIGPLCLIRPD